MKVEKMENANFVYLVHLVHQYLPDKDGNSIEETVRLLIEHATNDQVHYGHTSLNNFAARGPSSAVARKILGKIDKEKSSLISYLSRIGDDQLSFLSDKLKQDGITNDVYRGRFPSVFNKLFMKELHRVADKKNNSKQKIPTNGENEFIFEKTVSDDNFSAVFNQVNVSQISAVKNKNAIYAFVLKPELVPFRYAELENLVEENLTNYALARGGSRDAVVGLHTAKSLRKYAKSGSTTNLLGELLNYIFLEHAERALKIYTRAEVFETFRTIDSDGLYLRREDGKAQLVLGTAQIKDELQDAIDSVIARLSNQIDGYSSGAISSTDIVDVAIMQTQFGLEDGKSIIDLIDPGKGEVEELASYGLFIGYKFKTDIDIYDCSPEDSKRICQQIVLNDLKKAVARLNEAIQKHHWQRSSFYVYLLPFNDAEKDSQKIMEDLIGGW